MYSCFQFCTNAWKFDDYEEFQEVSSWDLKNVNRTWWNRKRGELTWTFDEKRHGAVPTYVLECIKICYGNCLLVSSPREIEEYRIALKRLNFLIEQVFAKSRAEICWMQSKNSYKSFTLLNGRLNFLNKQDRIIIPLACNVRNEWEPVLQQREKLLDRIQLFIYSTSIITWMS